MRKCVLTLVLIFALSARAANAPETQQPEIRKLDALIGPAQVQALTARLESLNEDIGTHGLHDYPGAHGRLITGYANGEFYDWDLYFESLYLSYYGVNRYDFTNFKVFLERQQPDGFISRTLGVRFLRPTQMFKPFLAQIAVLGSNQNNDYEWLRDRYYERLQRYVDRWFAYDNDHNGLPVWNSAEASGMDNQISRSGIPNSYFDEGVDLACYLYRELQAMAIIANHLGKPEDQKKYLDHAAQLAKTINAVFWNEKDGFYYDRNEKTGKPIKIKSVAGFLPLWAGVASPEQAKRLVNEHLLNPREFWLQYPVATYAQSEPEFFQGNRGQNNWQGPAWVPTNYMIFHGLLQYGFDDAARQLALKTLDMALNKNATTREYYDSDTGRGNGSNPFWGWSSLAYVMPLDLVDHYNPMDLNASTRPLIKTSLGISFEDKNP